MQNGYKFQIQPKKEQQTGLHEIFDGCIFIYNHYLNKAIETKKWDFDKASVDLSNLILTTPHIKNLPVVSLRHSLRHLEQAFSSFNRGRSPYPAIKSKNKKQTATFIDCESDMNKINIPGIGWISLIKRNKCFVGSGYTMTISYVKDRYYASWLV